MGSPWVRGRWHQWRSESGANLEQGLGWTSGPRTPCGNRAGGRCTQHPAERILKTDISCKQDISFCQRDQKGLEVFLHTLSLAYVCLSLALSIHFCPQAGRDGSRGDAALCKGLQQAQGPRHALAPGAPAGNGLPGTHRVSTVPPAAGHGLLAQRRFCLCHRTAGSSEQ